MELILTGFAVLSIALGILIACPPQSEIDRSIKDAARYPADKAAMARAIKGGRR